VIDPAASRRTRDELKRYERALHGFAELRAGPAGLLELVPEEPSAQDPLLAPSTTWTSVTPYQVERHVNAGSRQAAIEVDLRASLRRNKQPAPIEVKVQELLNGSGGLSGRASVTFAHAVEGPLLLGRTAHRGGGLFVGAG
jgi:CRISPR-associated protein Csb2